MFKILWYRDHEPELFGRIHKVLGTKDYVNYRLTGRLATDYSYASGSGVYDLLGWDYADELLSAADLSRDLLPEIVPATEVLGGLSGEAAGSLGLPPGIPVACGGVDNSCMAPGARILRKAAFTRRWDPRCGLPSLEPSIVGRRVEAVCVHARGARHVHFRDRHVLGWHFVLGARPAVREPGGPGSRRRPRRVRRDDGIGRAVAAGGPEAVVQPEPGRRFVTGAQPAHSRRVLGWTWAIRKPT